MSRDLFDDVKAGISEELGGDPNIEIDYAVVEAFKAFGKFLRSRRFYAVDEMLDEMQDMLLLPRGDFRDEFDAYVKG